LHIEVIFKTKKKPPSGGFFLPIFAGMRFLLTLGLVVFLFGCKKEYTCVCTTNTTATVPGIGTYDMGSQTQQHTAKLKKKEKDDWCKSFETTATANETVMPGVSVTATLVTTCTL
jgi:hypothetical protein